MKLVRFNVIYIIFVGMLYQTNYKYLHGCVAELRPE